MVHALTLTRVPAGMAGTLGFYSIKPAAAKASDSVANS